jgi:hypothetical protein
MSFTPVDAAFDLVTDAAARDGRDLDADVAQRQARNFFTHAASLAMTKTADGLIDPKLVLSWLLVHLGAPVFFVGLLVPVREAGALLPQMPLAHWLQGVTVRKWIWVAGSAVQGLAALAIMACGLILDGWAAGAAIVGLLGILAVARSACSLSHKDVLGKTVAKSARGTATGFASSMAAAAVIGFGLVLTFMPIARIAIVLPAIAIAGALWVLAAMAFSTLYEKPAKVSSGKTEGARLAGIGLLRDDPQLRIFIVTRGLLISTALAPPFLVSLAGAGNSDGSGGYGALGLLVLASAAASLMSSYVWGRLADRSSRKVLIIAGLAGAVSLGGAVALNAVGLLSNSLVLPAVLFALMTAYHGVRMGRSTHLVDMAPADLRSAYTALANTLIGVLVIAGGAVSAFAAFAGPGVAVLLLAAASLAAAGVAAKLENVQA